MYGIAARLLARNPGFTAVNLPVFSLRPPAGYFAQQRWALRVFGTLFAIFAGIALLLAPVGLYAVLAAGIRRLLLGLLLGLAAALAVTRVIAGLLVRVDPADPPTFAAISLLLGAVAVLACWLPARRAMRVDPAVALRHEW